MDQRYIFILSLNKIDRERKLKLNKKLQKKSEMSECTFKPKINDKPVLSPSKNYRYHDLKKNTNFTYNDQLEAIKQVRKIDNYYLLN